MTLRPSRAAAEAPDAPALVLPDRAVTFGELPALVEARRPRVVGRAFVACVAEPTLETFVTFWTAFELGVPFVPLHPRLPAAAHAELLARLDATPPPPGTAAVVWTSGTTGAARGVCLSAANLVAAADASAANLGWYAGDRWLCTLPLAHVGGLTIPVRCLLARRAVVALPRFSEAAVLAAIDDPHLAPTLASFVPTMLTRLLAADDRNALGRLRAILVGGDAAPAALLDACRARRVVALATYGLTEAGGQVTTVRLGDPARVTPDAGAGPPLDGVELRVDDEGHVLVRGPSIARTFLGERAGDDAPARGAYAYRATDEWLDTGDLGVLDAAGRLHPTGRAKDLVVTGGENVSPARVEAVLSRCPGVGAALVYGIADPTWGEVVGAALVATRATPPSDAEVLAHAAQDLAPHERPRHITWMAALPTTPAGKLDREALRLTARPRTPCAPRPGSAPAGTSRG